MEKNRFFCYNIKLIQILCSFGRYKHMKAPKILSSILCILLLLSLFSSCGGTDVKAFYFAVREKAGTFDPTVASDTTARTIVRNCFEGLVYPDENGELVPGAAESWTVSPDGLTYTFRIRADAKWHLTSNAEKELEGKLPENFDLRVTAYDFEFGLKRALDPAMGAADAYKLSVVAGAAAVAAGKAGLDSLGIKALSADELQITLSQPQNDFLYVLAEPLCMPCNETFFNATGGRYGIFIKDFLSNGPFYLSYFDDGAYRITKNPDYTGAHEAQADVVRFYVNDNDDSVFTALRDGDYTGAYMNESQLESFGVSKKNVVFSTADKTRAFILNEKSEPLSDVSVRMAFLLATDTEKVASRAERTPVHSPLPAAVHSGFTGNVIFDESKAVSVLSAALEKAGINSVTVSLKCEARHEFMLKKQLQSWQKIFGTSFNIDVVSMSAEELKRDVKNGDYDIAFYPVAASSASAEDFFLQFTAASSQNIFGTDDEAFDLAVKALGSASEEDADTSLANVCRAVADNAVMLPVWSESTYFVCVKDTAGVILLPGEDNVYFYNCN